MSVLNPYYEVVFRSGRARLTLTALTGAYYPIVGIELASTGNVRKPVWVEDDKVLARLAREALAGNPVVLDYLLERPGLDPAIAEAIAGGMTLDELDSEFNPGLGQNLVDETARTLTCWTGVDVANENPGPDTNLAGYTWMADYDPDTPAWLYGSVVTSCTGLSLYDQARYEVELGWTGRMRWATERVTGYWELELRTSPNARTSELGWRSVAWATAALQPFDQWLDDLNDPDLEESVPTPG